jgi:hydroxyethylthiazole kinase-like sugar kinase family protein
MFRRIGGHQYATESLDDVMAALAIVFICGLVAAIVQSFVESCSDFKEHFIDKLKDLK